MNNLFFDLPEHLQDKIIKMKEEIEKNQKFNDWITKREQHNKQMDEYNARYKYAIMPFGKYKGWSIYGMAICKARYATPIGQNYLQWVSKNVDINNPLLKEVIEFYKDYYYHHTDGCD